MRPRTVVQARTVHPLHIGFRYASRTDRETDWEKVVRDRRPPPPRPPSWPRLLGHVRANAALYGRVLGPHGSPGCAVALRTRLTRELTARFERGERPAGAEEVPAAVHASFLAGALIGVITHVTAADGGTVTAAGAPGETVGPGGYDADSPDAEAADVEAADVEAADAVWRLIQRRPATPRRFGR